MALVIDDVGLELETTLGANNDDVESQKATTINVTLDRKRNANPINLSFNEIDYQIQIKNVTSKEMETKTILNNISGECKAGSMLAIMGPTGKLKERESRDNDNHLLSFVINMN